MNQVGEALETNELVILPLFSSTGVRRDAERCKLSYTASIFKIQSNKTFNSLNFTECLTHAHLKNNASLMVLIIFKTRVYYKEGIIPHYLFFLQNGIQQRYL